MVPSKSIEDQFRDAVKVALEVGDAVSRSSEMTTHPKRMRRHGRAHTWFVAFLLTTLTATLTILFLSALRALTVFHALNP